MTVKKANVGRPRLLKGKEPRQYSFKAAPELDDELIRTQADLEAYDIRASKAGILRFLVTQTLPNAVELIRNHVEGDPHGAAESQEHPASNEISAAVDAF